MFLNHDEDVPVFHFSATPDAAIYASDFQKLVDCVRKNSSSKVFVHVPSFSYDEQIFVLAESPEQASEIYESRYPHRLQDDDIGKALPEHFTRGDIQ